MKRAWDQFGLITLGAMVLVYAIGLYRDLPLDQILLRSIVVGGGLLVLFAFVHLLLSMVFVSKSSEDRQEEVEGHGAFDQTVDDDLSAGTLIADGGRETQTKDD